MPEHRTTPQQGTYLCDNAGDSASRFGLGSSDLGIPYRRYDGSWGYVFGDSFRGQGATGEFIGSPVVLYQADFDATGQTPITFTAAEPLPTCAQLFDYQHNADNGFGFEVSRIPNDAITLTVDGRNRIFIQYTSVHRWVGPRSRVDGSLMAGIAYSDDNGASWQDFERHWPGDGQGNTGSLDMMWSFAGVDPDGLLYVFSKAWNGSHFYADDRGRIQLFRYQPADFFRGDLDAREHWVYLDQTWQWVPAAQAAPSSLFGPDNGIGEFSVKRIGELYVMSYFDVTDFSIRTRTAPRPDRVWTAPKTQVVGSTLWPPTHWFRRRQPFPYGGYLHPGSASPENLTLLISSWDGQLGHRPYTVTQWSGLAA
ncbi:DUF4185 domain-containing protein [Nocardia brasiliensis]|uniref:DUF4185 domain-containing protein n=1 Tax=Nocardia brasiliensis TaxID=37326 RepID=A0A6G9XVM7_NOCBR|nr:DUF4185 domain-containing protein [Nocardia brasiliensis]QIS04927.1 DUF4185 domain-containing protein [Nocardia brasiliensis]